VPSIPAELPERLRQFQAVRNAAFRGWYPDEQTMLIVTRFGDTNQLHRVSHPGGRREQLTFQTEPVNGRPVPGSSDGAIILSVSQGGNENDQVLQSQPTEGRFRLLTDGKSRNLLGPIHRELRTAVIHSNRRNGRDTDLFLCSLDSTTPLRPLLEVSNEHWNAMDWSPDGQRLLLQKYVSINESLPAILEVSTGRLTPLPLAGPAPSAATAMRFAADGRSFYLATDLRGEFRELANYDLETHQLKWLTPQIPWDVTEIDVHPKTGQVAFLTNEDGAGGMYLLEAGQPRKFSLPLGTLSDLEFHPDGLQLGFTLGTPSAPTDAWSLRISTGELTRWTYSETGGLPEQSFVTARRISFRSFDGREIPAYYFQPRKASPQSPVPVLINIHGGPESQYRPVFSGLDQFHCNELGIAVIHPNVRGSAGYGKTFLKLDNAERREDAVRDIGALLDWIAKQPELDPTRVAVMGGSYGGYMVLASLTTYPDRLRAGIDVVGIASFRSFLKNTSPYRQDLRRAEYGDERLPAMQEFFARIDPLERAGDIRSKLLVIHGKNDPRVPFSEARQIADRVRELGGDVWSVYADNEGHGFSKKPNRDYQNAVVAQFLQYALELNPSPPGRQP
jgi:dipeptidyl aminopeptidase/acylaminoacyl peptidase